MSRLSKIVVIVSCLYLILVPIRLQQSAAHLDGKHQVLMMALVSSLTAISFLAIGVFLLLTISWDQGRPVATVVARALLLV